MEVDSDDEDPDSEEEEPEQEQGEGEEEAASGRGRGEEPQAQRAEPETTATTGPPLDRPSASSVHGDPEEDGSDGSPPQPEGAPPEEGAGGAAGELEAQKEEPASPSAGAAAGLGPAAEAEGGKGADGAQQPRFGPQRMFMDEVVERVCDCDLETEEVQLQVIKALVHACTATTLAVHQASLLTAVKTIYTVSAVHAMPSTPMRCGPMLVVVARCNAPLFSFS